jgi:integrase
MVFQRLSCRALLGDSFAYTFARIGAVVNLKVEDYYPSGKRFLLRFKEKGGKEKELPVHHKLEELLDQYLKQAVWRRSRKLGKFGAKQRQVRSPTLPSEATLNGPLFTMAGRSAPGRFRLDSK